MNQPTPGCFHFLMLARIAMNIRMRIEADHYRVRPRKTSDGCNLESERLSHDRLWYTNETDAISYAKWLSRVKGCNIEILDQTGQILRTEVFPPGNFAY